MACPERLQSLSALADGELPESARTELELHLAQCADCRGQFASLNRLRQALREHLPRYSAPAALRQRVQRAIARPAPAAPRFRWMSLAAAASIAILLAASGFYGGWLFARGGSARTPAEALVLAHAGALQRDQFIAVASSEHHVVKPWFTGKLDYSPPVTDLGGAGFPLLGARVDSLKGRPTAALAYAHGPHRITLYVWPADRPDTATVQAKAERPVRGFNLVSGTVAEMRYRAVSDLNAAELLSFARQWQGAVAAGQ